MRYVVWFVTVLQLIALAALALERAWLAIGALVAGELLGVLSIGVLAIVVNRWALGRAPKRPEFSPAKLAELRRSPGK